MPDTNTPADESAWDHAAHDVALTDVMLAMDVVDTLRHQESLVARELDADAREAELIARVRRMYRSQGIEVSDSVVAEGVTALREQRFTYTPPPGGLVTTILRAWVGRRGLAKRALAIVGVVGLLWSGWCGLVTLPAQRARVNEAQALNSRIDSAARSVRELDERREGIAEALDAEETTSRPASVTGIADEQRRLTRTALDRVDTLLTSAADLTVTGRVTADDMEDVGISMRSRLDQQQEVLDEAGGALDDADASLSALRRARVLPDELDTLRAEVDQFAQDARATSLAANHHRDGLAALARGDLAGVDAATGDLRSLVAALTEEYTLTIVSRPDERTGVWRFPEGNPNARNYYLIVEAIDRDGSRLSRSVTSEEDGQVRTVTIWGLRVEQAAYDRIARDKQDDGIVQDNVFGVKRRGYLEPDYRIPTTGGAITSWEDR